MGIFDKLKMVNALTDEDKKHLETFCQVRELEAWEVLFNEWDDANSMYFLETWAIEIFKEIDWESIVIWKVDAEEILWEMALFGWQWKRMATAKAVEQTRLITILSFSIKEITEKYPELMKKIQEVIEIRSMSNKVLESD